VTLTSYNCRIPAGAELDAAFATLRMLNKRVAALSHMAHQPSSCSSAQGVSVNAQVGMAAPGCQQSLLV
jgi:hypothetical protein